MQPLKLVYNNVHFQSSWLFSATYGPVELGKQQQPVSGCPRRESSLDDVLIAVHVAVVLSREPVEASEV